MLRLVLALTLVAVCFAQQKPNIPETFSSAGAYEFHDNRGTFFGEFVNDRDQGKNEAVENATYKVGDNLEHYELLELYSLGKRYTIRDEGKGDVHCQVEDVSGSLPKFWSWLADATFKGNVTYHEVLYDQWMNNVGGVEFLVLVPQDDPNVPKFLRRRSGPTITGFEFRMFSATEPAQSDFSVPKECTTARRHSM
jgi:hypothetical protein